MRSQRPHRLDFNPTSVGSICMIAGPTVWSWRPSSPYSPVLFTP
jgi:hypothetical protein